LIYWIRYFLIS